MKKELIIGVSYIFLGILIFTVLELVSNKVKQYENKSLEEELRNDSIRIETYLNPDTTVDNTSFWLTIPPEGEIDSLYKLKYK